MWTDRPRAWTDGLLLATAVGMVLCVIVSIGRETDPVPATLPQCQEVVVIIHQDEEILATCPPGTWLDIVDNANVVCRCGEQRTPKFFITPRQTPRKPQADPPRKDDKPGIEI